LADLLRVDIQRHIALLLSAGTKSHVVTCGRKGAASAMGYVRLLNSRFTADGWSRGADGVPYARALGHAGPPDGGLRPE
jgi:hypothetical protein